MSETVARRREFAMVPDSLVTDERLSSHAVRVWIRLDRYAGKCGGALPSRETLAADLSLSVDVVRRALSDLFKAGWITRERVGASNVWETTLHDSPVDRADVGRQDGRPGAGAKVVRQRAVKAEERRISAPIPDEERRIYAPIVDENGAKNGAKNGAYMRRPRKEKTNERERTTSSLDGAQLAVLDIDEPATPAVDDGASRRPANERGTRIPDDWYPDQDLIAWTREHAPDVGPPDVEEFRNYWLSVPGARGRKVRWDLTWRNRATEIQARRTRQTAPRPGVYDPDRSRETSRRVAEACERAGVSNLIELMIKESGE